MAGSPKDIDALDAEGLKGLLLQVLEENAALCAEVAALREENRRLKGLKGPPTLKPSKPSGMEKATAAKRRKPGRRGPKTPRAAVEEVVLQSACRPIAFQGLRGLRDAGSPAQAWVIRYRRERWLTPEARRWWRRCRRGLARATSAPSCVASCSRSTIRASARWERTTRLLQDIGIDISKRQVQRLLTDKQEGFLAEDRAVLRAGLATAAWISVDDTGARHGDGNATCTRIGDARFTSFATTSAKSRLNFLELLAGSEPAYTVNAAALAYMRKRQLPEVLIARLAASRERSFGDKAAWDAHLAGLAIPAADGSRDPARVASEGALWGGLAARGFADTVVLSDDAGQFNLGRHALCWVHAERLVHKLDTFCDRQARVKAGVRTKLWALYGDLKGYARDPAPADAAALRQRFDRLVATRTSFATLDRLLARPHAGQPGRAARGARPPGGAAAHQ